jgi:MFS family permease
VSFERPGLSSGAWFVVGTVSGGHLLSHFCLLAFPPLFPLLREEFGASATELGIIITAIHLPVMLLQLPVGKLVDQIGAKRVFVAGVGLTGLATFLAGMATSYYILLAFALLAGVGQSCFHPSDYALLSAVVEDDSEGKGFGVHTFGGYIGFAAAPLVIGGLGLATGWRTALFTAGVAGIVYAVLAQLTLGPVYLDEIDDEDEDATGSGTFLQELRSLLSPTLGGIFLLFMFLFMAGTGIQSFTAVFLVSAYELPESVGNTALTSFFAMSAVGVLAGGVLADTFDIHWLSVVTLLLAGALTVGLAFPLIPITVAVALLAFGAIGLLSGLMRPSRDSLVSYYSPPESSGRSFGLVFSGGSLGGTISPFLLGFVIDTVAVSASFLLIGAFFMACSAIVVWIKLANRPGAV